MILFLEEEIEQFKIEPARYEPKTLYFSGVLKAKKYKNKLVFIK